jgi:hypothetical protein
MVELAVWIVSAVVVGVAVLVGLNIVLWIVGVAFLLVWEGLAAVGRGVEAVAVALTRGGRGQGRA